MPRRKSLIASDKPHTLECEADLRTAIDDLCSHHNALAQVWKRLEYVVPPLRFAEPGYPSLLRIIVDQQISRAAADAIWSRVGGHLQSPEAALEAGRDRIAAIGLSRPKAAFAILIGERVLAGEFEFESLADLGNEEARARLLSLPGIGPWTAEIYLMTALRRADAFPPGDVALQEAARRAFGL